MSKPVLQIVLGSTRPGRAGAAVTEWFTEQARAHGGFEVAVADLAEVNLPLFDEPNHPMTGAYEHEHTRAWSALVARANALVFVTPEYNHGYPAALKNALDYLNREWRYKACGFVSYGGVSAGLRAVHQLKQVVTALRMVPVTDAVSIPFIPQRLDESRTFQSDEIIDSAAKQMLDELLHVGTPLIPLQMPPNPSE